MSPSQRTCSHIDLLLALLSVLPPSGVTVLSDLMPYESFSTLDAKALYSLTLRSSHRPGVLLYSYISFPSSPS